MKRPWRTLAIAGSFSLAALAASICPAEEKLVPVPETQADAGMARSYRPAGCPACEARAAAAAGTAYGGAAYGTQSVVGDYRVGHIHEGPFEHLTGHSFYNPYLDLMHQPVRQVTYGGAHARYYAGYRNVYSPNWHEFYRPRYYAPAAYGYDPYGASYYGYGQTRSSFYGPNYSGPVAPGVANTQVPPAPPSGYRPSGIRYTGEPGLYSPYGVGSSSYFGAYGSAGY